MGFMSKATRDKLRGLSLADKVKSLVTGPTKDATGEPNSQSPRRSSGNFMPKAVRDKLRGLGRIVTDKVKSRVTGPTKDATGDTTNSQSPRRSFGGRPAGGNIDMNRRSARSGTAGGRARMFSEGGEAQNMYKNGGEAKVKGVDMDKNKTKSSKMTFAEKVAADNRDEDRKAEARAAKERAAATTEKAKSFKNGGMVKDSSSGTTRGVGKARKQTFRIY